MISPVPDSPVLSICLRCRDGREGDANGLRGGRRLADAVLAASERCMPLKLRGVDCMSQCTRACVAALGAPGRFTYLFGDLDPSNADDVAALLALPPLFAAAPEGFLPREERPEPLRARTVGRLPPFETASDLVTPLSFGNAA